MSIPVPAFRYALERAGDFEMPVLRRGPENTPVVIFAQPLFEEHNRCRRFFADLGRALAELGIATALPDLPRTGDHVDVRPFDLKLASAALDSFYWQRPYPAAAVVSLRGGHFLCGPGQKHFALSPVAKGERLLVDLIRAHAVGVREAHGKSFTRADAEAAWADKCTLTLAGHPVTANTAEALSTASTELPSHMLNIAGADADIAGPSIWRQAEPEPTVHVAHAAAARIAEWVGNP